MADAAPVADEPSAAGDQLAASGSADADVQATEAALREALAVGSVQFASGTGSLTAGSREILDGVADALARYPTVGAEVQGHTDSQGGEASNRSLSQRRADAVGRALLDARARVGRLEAAPVASVPAASVGDATLFGAPAERPVDDLKVISGIVPKTESQLAGIGVTTYQQIATLTPADIERVNDTTGVFRGRIEREDWVAQARRLHREAYGDDA